jgi:hypothetical protein
MERVKVVAFPGNPFGAGEWPDPEVVNWTVVVIGGRLRGCALDSVFHDDIGVVVHSAVGFVRGDAFCFGGT